MDQNSTVKFYEGLVAEGTYDERAGNTDRAPIEQFFREIEVSGKRIIDLGCGTGSIADVARLVSGKWASYIGIDSSAAVAEIFNARAIPNARAEVSSVTSLGTQADSSADIVLCLFLLQDLSPDDGLKTLREIQRIARPNADGLFGLTVNVKRTEQPKFYRGRWTYIWNSTKFVQTLGAHGFATVWELERPGPTSDYRRVYIRATNAQKSSPIQDPEPVTPNDAVLLTQKREKNG